MNWKSLDGINVDKPLNFSQDNTIYEHYRLLRTQNISCFDAIIYIDEPVELSKAKILQRKRGGLLVDILDYERLKKVGDKAFSIADGDQLAIPDSFIKIKIKQKQGFRAYENIEKEVMKKGIKNLNFSKEQLIFIAIENEVRKGFLSYVNANAYTQEILTGVAKGLFKTIVSKT